MAENRSATINIRVRERQRDLIDQAAEVLGKSRSDFMLETACREAQDVLLDQRVFRLDEAAFRAFIERLDARPEPTEALKKLLATKAPWE